MFKSNFSRRFLAGLSLATAMSASTAFGQFAEPMDMDMDMNMEIGMEPMEMTQAPAASPNIRQLSSVAASDRAAFAAVYQFLAEDYFQREQIGDLYDTYVGNQPAQQKTNVAAYVQTDPSEQELQVNGFGSDVAANSFPTSPEQNGSFVPVNPIDTPLADLGEIEDLALDEDFSDDADAGNGGIFSNVYLGAYVAGNYTKKATIDLTNPDTFDMEPQPGYGGGGLIGYKLGPIHAELEGLYAQSTRKTANSTDVAQQADDEEETTTTIAGLANAYYKLDLGPVGVFGGGSVGYAQYKRKFGTDESTGKGLTYGPLVGAAYKINSNMEIAAQYRYLMASKVEMTNDVSGLITEEDMSQHQAMLALRISF